MKNLLTLAFLIMSALVSQAQNAGNIAEVIIALEKAALDEWGKGNPTPYLELSAADVVYFDPGTEKRLDGIEQLTALYESIRGMVHVDRFDMKNPKVQAVSDMAVLTFNLDSYAGENILKWNCTEVYRKEKNGGWKLIQTHWSFVKPEMK